MTDLDFSVEGMEPRAEDYAEPAPAVVDPWLARRGNGFGASDVPVLLVALGYCDAGDLPKYMRDRVAVTNRTRGAARIFAEKAGVVAPLKSGAAAAVGTANEERLLLQWQTLLTRRQWYGPHERLLAPSSLTLAKAAPREWYPLIDRVCPVLTCTPDAWMRDAMGGLVKVEAKCTVREQRDVRWTWVAQVQAQLAVTGAESGVVVCGDGWAATWLDGYDGPSGPVRSWPVERDEAAISQIREAAARGWEIVERLRAAKVEAA